MKICFLGNAESIHTQRWVKYFASKGHDIHLLSFSFQTLDGITVHKIPEVSRMRPLAFPFRVSHIKKVIRQIRPDILHVHTVWPLGIYGAFLAFHPLVLTAWGSDVLIKPKESRLFKAAIGYALKKADCITFSGEHMVEVLIRLGANPGKLTVNYLGTNTREFSPEKRSEKLRQKLGINSSLAIISLRNLTPLYDIESLIRAIPLVLAQVPDAKFVIVGKGPEEENLHNLADSLGVSNNIRFAGFIPIDEVSRYLASSDIYVSTSLSDAGLAASTAEAMSCGLPVVITDFGDNGKWVVNGVNGFIIPLRSPGSLASKIIRLLNSKEDRVKFGQANRQIIEEKNSSEREMGKLEKIYEELFERYKKT